jgi:hypothetical protein
MSFVAWKILRRLPKPLLMVLLGACISRCCARVMFPETSADFIIPSDGQFLDDALAGRCS